MSTKTIRKQLAAAVAMVLVAALALGSSTFAWFAQNNKVTAEGISITAQAEGKLLVIDTTASFTTTLTSAAMTKNETNATKILPTHPVYTATALSGWKHNTSDNYSVAISGTTTEGDVSNPTGDAATAAANYYYLSDELYIHMDNTSGAVEATDLILSNLTVTASGGNSDTKTLLNIVRVMLVTTAVDGTTKTVNVYTADGSHVTTDISADGATALVTEAKGTNDPVLAAKVNTTADVKVEVYIYFDGRDTNCTSAKYDTDSFAVALEFSATI